MVNVGVALSLLFSTCSTAGLQDGMGKSIGVVLDTSKILIVYLSRTNNRKALAEIIQENVGGTLVALELEKPYPQNYKEMVQQVVMENETGYVPPLKTKMDSIEKYEVVFVGFPTWAMKLPPPMKSFLSRYDWSDKTVIPFNSNAGYGTGTSFETVKGLCKAGTVLEGYATQGGVERDGVLFVMEGEKRRAVQLEVRKWLQQIGVMKAPLR